VLFDIERGINGLAADERLRIRKQQSAPFLAGLETWLREQRSRMSRSASVAGPIDYMLKRWDWFARFIGDGLPDQQCGRTRTAWLCAGT
jgi:transposase